MAVQGAAPRLSSATERGRLVACVRLPEHCRGRSLQGGSRVPCRRRETTRLEGRCMAFVVLVVLVALLRVSARLPVIQESQAERKRT